MSYFTPDNCDYNAAQREWANQFVRTWLQNHGDPDGNDNDFVKSACDLANDSLPEVTQ